MVRGIIYFILTAVVIVLGIYAGMSLYTLIDAGSVFIVLVGGLALLYLAFPVSDWCEAIGFVFSGKKEIPRGKHLKLVLIYKAAGEFFLYCGVLGTFIGSVLMLCTMQDPSTIGPKLAVAMITIVYGVSGYLFTLLMQRKACLCGVNEETYEIKPRKASISFSVSLIVFLVVMVLGITTAGPLSVFFDLASVLIVAGGAIFLALLCSGPGDISSALKSAFSQEEVTVEEAEKGLKVFYQLIDSVVFMFILAFMVAFLALLVFSFEPSTIGPKVAIMMISFIYGVVLISFFRGFCFVLKRKLCAKNKLVELKPFFSAGFILLYGLFLSFFIWGGILATMQTTPTAGLSSIMPLAGYVTNMETGNETDDGIVPGLQNKATLSTPAVIANAPVITPDTISIAINEDYTFEWDVSNVLGAKGVVIEISKANHKFQNPNGEVWDRGNAMFYDPDRLSTTISGLLPGNALELEGPGVYQYRVSALNANKELVSRFSDAVELVVVDNKID
ncbi:MAG: hypothetical protein U9P14_09445 [Gemmatimonadota bacterium]|nr:hypothetical protein [Gemmatimonadota bacterium]